MIRPHLQQNKGKLIRKTVGRPLEELSVFDRMRQLQTSLEKMGLAPNPNDGEHIRRTVGVAPKK